MLYYLVVPTKKGTLDAFSFNKVHKDSRFMLQETPCSPAPLRRSVIKNAEFNMQFAISVFSYCFLYCSKECTPYCMSLEKLRQYTGFTYGSHGIDVESELRSLSGVYGVIDDAVVPLIEDIEVRDDAICFKSIYFYELIAYMREAYESGERHSFYTSLLKVSALKWRNRSAFEVATVMCSLAERRGSYRGGKAELRLEKLLKQCPLFAHRYSKAVDSKKNEVLKTVLYKALEYLSSDNVFDAKYKGVNIELPTELNRFKLTNKITIKVGKKHGD